MTLYQQLPSVDKALAHLDNQSVPRPLLRELVTDFLNTCRFRIKENAITATELEWNNLLPQLKTYVKTHARPHFRRVLNATGVVIHTNLGRSILHEDAVQAVTRAAQAYSNLEFSLETGTRGSRYAHVEKLLCLLTGAEAGLVVNNNAAAVMLILDTLAKNREVIVSRGQLVEIGGSFRIPDIMARSGAILCEVGATNRTHLSDYEQAINDNTAALLKVHTSNYRMIGFTCEVPLSELTALGQKHNLPVIEDLGSGNLFNFSSWQMEHEPTVQQVISAGADIVCFSGDKLLGGPQAGIILGKKNLIERIKKNQMNRALRIDKMTLAALEATLRLYLDPERARKEIPTLRMITMTAEEIEIRARQFAHILTEQLKQDATVSVLSGQSRVGGGAFPEQDLPTFLVTIKCSLPPEKLKQKLLKTNPALIGRIENNNFCLDVRTLDDTEFSLAGEALAQALNADCPSAVSASCSAKQSSLA